MLERVELIKLMCEKVRAKRAYKSVSSEDIKFDLLEYAFMFSGPDKTYSTVQATVEGKIAAKLEVLHNYCPFCGQSYDQDPIQYNDTRYNFKIPTL